MANGGNKLALAGGATLLVLLYLWRNRKRVFLEKKRKAIMVKAVEQLSHDTKLIRLCLGTRNTLLGLPVGKHIKIFCPNPTHRAATGLWNGRQDEEKKPEIERKYTPCSGDETPGHVDLVIKVYRPGITKMPDGKEVTWTDGGKMSLYLDSKKPGDYIEIDGPLGANEYFGQGKFKLPGRTLDVDHVCMMAGGTGVTPMLQVIQASLQDAQDKTRFTLLYANKTESDILCRDLLEDAQRRSNGRVSIHYTLDFPPSGWQQHIGFITKEMIAKLFPSPDAKPLILMCGPPPMVKFACQQNLEALGYDKLYRAEF
jgi:cytochrome-b5 reductase